jgi:hypothetical protein
MIATLAPATTTPQICGGPAGFSFEVSNYGDLLAFQQQYLRQVLQNHFMAAPYVSGNSLRLNVLFPLPIHTGIYCRRVEMLIFNLHCQISPYLHFRQSFIY